MGVVFYPGIDVRGYKLKHGGEVADDLGWVSGGMSGTGWGLSQNYVFLVLVECQSIDKAITTETVL